MTKERTPDTRKDEIEGMFAGMEASALRAKKLICCWPPPGHSLDADEILDQRHAQAKRVLTEFEQAVNALPGAEP